MCPAKRGNRDRRRRAFRLVLLIGVLALLAGCMLLSEDYAEKKRAEMISRNIDNVCAELSQAGISENTDADEVAAILFESSEVDEVTECEDGLLTVRLSSGVVCYIMLDFEEETETSGVDAPSIAQHVPNSYPLSETTRTGDCPPWTSEKVLVVRAVSEMSDVGKLRMQQTVDMMRRAGFVVDYLEEEEFTPATLDTLSDYGFVFLVGHGGPLLFQTGLKVTPATLQAYDVANYNEALAPLIYFGDEGPESYISFTLKYDFPSMNGTLFYLNGCKTASRGLDGFTLAGELLNCGASVSIGNLKRIRAPLASAVLKDFCEDFFLERSTLADAIEAARSRFSHIAFSPGYSFVSLNAAPVAEIRSSGTSGGRPLQITFSAEGSYDPDDSELLFRWDFGDGFSADGQDVSHMFETSGRFTVELLVSDPCGLTSNTTVNVQIDPAPCDLDLEPPSVGLNCETPSSSRNVSFTWSGSDNCSTSLQYQYKLDGRDTTWSSWSSSTSKSYSGLSAGTYTFCVKAKDEKGNVSPERCCNITVEEEPVPLPIGETRFRGTAIAEAGLVGAVNWTVRVDEVLQGVDISTLEVVAVTLAVTPLCYGSIIGNIQPGDSVLVFGYCDGAAVNLCPDGRYFLMLSETQGDLALVSRGASATASSWGSYGGYDAVPNAAIDGSHDRGWGGTQGEGDWLKIDLGSVYNIQMLRIDNGYHSLEYGYCFSTDGVSWGCPTTFISSTGDHDISDPLANIETITFPGGTPMRYIRIDILRTNAPPSHIWQVIIDEVEAFAQLLY